MYDRDMPLMRAHALASPSGFVDVVAFVLSTIQQPLQSVGNQMAEIRAHGAASKYLFGSKRPGLTYAMAHAAALHAAVTAAVDASDTILSDSAYPKPLSNFPNLLSPQQSARKLRPMLTHARRLVAPATGGIPGVNTLPAIRQIVHSQQPML
jgi:hypothetical protein